MTSKSLLDIARDGRKKGVTVKRVGDMIFDEAHEAVPTSQEKVEHLEDLRRKYSEKPDNS